MTSFKKIQQISTGHSQENCPKSVLLLRELTLGLIRELTLGECLSMGALTLHSLEQEARNLRQVPGKIARKFL